MSRLRQQRQIRHKKVLSESSYCLVQCKLVKYLVQQSTFSILCFQVELRFYQEMKVFYNAVQFRG